MVARPRGGAAPEAFRIDVKDQSDVLLASFNETDRMATAQGWTDINLNEYEFAWEKNGGLELTMDVSDPQRKFFDLVRKGHKVSLWLDNTAKGLLLSYDMETLLSSTSILDLSDTGNNGTITGTVDSLGWLGRARDFQKSATARIVSASNPAATNVYSIAIWLYLKTNATIDTDRRAIALNFDASSNGFIAVQWENQTTKIVHLNAGISIAGGDVDWTTKLNDWHRVVFTLNGASSWSIYVDGTLHSTGVPTATPSNLNDIFTLGQELYPFALDGLIGGFQFWNRVLTGEEVSADFKRFGTTPRKYIEGRVIGRKNVNGVTSLVVSSNFMNLLEHEVYDVIFEGTESSDTMLPSFINKKTFDFNKADADHDKQHIKLKTAEGADLTNTSHVYEPIKIEFPQFHADWGSPDDAYWALNSDPGIPLLPNKGLAIPFTPDDKVISKVWLLLNFRGQPSGRLVKVEIMDSDMNVITTNATETDGSSGFKWVSINFAGMFERLTVGNEYWLAVSNVAGNDEIDWKADRGTHILTRKLLVSNNQWAAPTETASANYLIIMKNATEMLNEGEYVLRVGSGGTKWIVDVETPDSRVALLGANVPSILNDFFVCTYLYTQNIKKASDVINRLLKPIGFTGVYVSAGGLGSTLTTYLLGFYAPSGGSIREHIAQVANLVGDRFEYFPPKRLRFSSYPEPSTPINGSFETLDKNGNLLGWSNTGTQASTAPFSGDKHVRHLIAATTADETETLRQDVENFDPRATYLNGDNAEIWLYRNAITTHPNVLQRLFVKLYEYGTTSNPVNLLTVGLESLAAQTWTRFTFKINRPSFRISIEVERLNVESGGLAGVDMFIDDVKFHGENFYSVCIKDSNYNDSTYTSGFIPNTRRSSLSENVIFIDDLDMPPSFDDEISESMINLSMVTGKTGGERTGPIIGMAKNPASVSQFDERFSAAQNESIKTLKDAYNKAKIRLRNQTSQRASIRLVGQYAWLSGKMPLIFFPDNGLSTPEFFDITSLTVGPSYTEIEVNKTVVEQLGDPKAALERKKMLEGVFEPETVDSLVFISHINLPAGTNLNAVTNARLRDEAGNFSPSKKLDVLDTRDAVVNSAWLFRVLKSDPVGFNTTTTNVWTQLRVDDSVGTQLASVTLPVEFARLPNMWVYVFIFAP